MKEQKIRVKSRGYTISPEAQKILAKTFNHSHKDDQFQRWIQEPLRQPLPGECKFCGSQFTHCRNDIFECLDCDSFLGKAFS